MSWQQRHRYAVTAKAVEFAELVEFRVAAAVDDGYEGMSLSKNISDDVLCATKAYLKPRGISLEWKYLHGNYHDVYARICEIEPQPLPECAAESPKRWWQFWRYFT